MRGYFPFLLMLLTLGVFFITYNLLSLVMPHESSRSDPEEWHDRINRNVRGGMRRLEHRAKFHVAVTATSVLYSRWQCQIMYYWYKKVKDSPGSDMGGFTRILHSGKPDNLMGEIPTMVVDPLPDGDRDYIVLNRPWAFVQWLEKAIIEEEYLLMAEPDHIFVRPLPNLAFGEHPAAFPFFYMKPVDHEDIIRKYYPEEKGPVHFVDPIGNSPVIIKKTVLKKIARTWMNISIRMKDDPEADNAFRWNLEMYGYAVASALHGVRHILRDDFMVQPPFDPEVGKTFILHYTFACDYNLKGEWTYGKTGEWRFDKRSYFRRPPPRNLSMPPLGVSSSVVGLIRMINTATADIPGWWTE